MSEGMECCPAGITHDLQGNRNRIRGYIPGVRRKRREGKVSRCRDIDALPPRPEPGERPAHAGDVGERLA